MNKTTLHLHETLDTLIQTAQFDTLIETSKAALLDARNHDDKTTEVLALIGLAQGHTFIGKFKDALLLTDGAMDLAPQIDDSHLAVQAILTRASVHLLGTYQIHEAESDYRLALSLAHDINDQVAIIDALIGIAAALNQQAYAGRAEGFAREAFEIAREIDNSYLIAQALTGIGTSLSKANQSEKALKAFQDATSIAQTENYRILEVTLMGNIGQLLVKQGRYAQEGQQMLEKALRMATEIYSVPHQFAILFTIGRASETQGLMEQAAEHYNTMLIRAQEWQTRAYEGMAFFNLGVLAFNRKHYDDALANLEQALMIARETQNPFQEAQVEQILGLSYSMLQDWENTLDHYMAARSLYDALDNEHMVRQMMQAIVLTYLQGIVAKLLGWLGLAKKEDTPPEA
jgi:tetratricopeptide (TPR) repeat protein